MHRFTVVRISQQTFTRQSVRFASSATESATNRSVYAPGFAPPKGSRETPKIVSKRRNVATSLPSHLGNAESSSKPATSPKKEYREKLRTMRHAYAQELLAKHGKLQAARATRLAENDRRTQQERKMHEQERQEALKHEAELLNKLQLELQGQQSLLQTITDRSAQRAANRKAHEEAQREARLKQLLKLYESTENFVTLENLDEKVEDALRSKVPIPYVTTLEEYMLSATTSPAEIERRKEAIKEVMGL